MRYNTYINNQKCLEWGLIASQGALFDLLNQASSWADEIIHEDKVFYHVSRSKILEELPLFYAKDDTAYRHLKDLQAKGLIEYVKVDKKDLIRLTAKGKEWNVFDRSLSTPTNQQELGFESEENEKTRISIRENSDLNPTDNITRNNIYNLDTSSLRSEVSSLTERINQIFEKYGLPIIRKMTAERLKKLRMRTVEAGGLDKFLEEIDKALAASSFLRGENNRGWSADIDFLLQKSSFVRLLEGAYADKNERNAEADYTKCWF